MSRAPAHAIQQRIDLRWSDQDLLGHVNNATIMTLVEEARIRTLAQLEQQLDVHGALDMVLRTTTTDFFRPVMYRGPVHVNVWISRIGTSSFVMQHEVAQDDEVYVSVEAVVVMFDRETQGSMPIPQALRTALETVTATA